MAKDARIIVETAAGERRLISKIVEYRNNGFGLMIPYHDAKRGWIAKLAVDYTLRTQVIQLDGMQSFEASSRVKLSYHTDGFAQFSSELEGAIRSGRAPDGSAKGVGLTSSSLAQGIASGPAAGVTAWGLEHFDLAAGERNSDLIFRESELLELDPLPIAPSLPAVHIQIFVMPGELWRKVEVGQEDRQSMTQTFPHRTGPLLLNLRVPDFDDRTYILGVRAERTRMQANATTGWQIQGPGWLNRTTGRGEVINAWYPNPREEKLDSLDYEAPGTTLGG